MSNVDTSTCTLPGEVDGEGPSRAQLRSIVSAVAATLVLVVVVAGYFIRTPWVAIRPGAAIATEPRIAVSGSDTFPSEGEVFLLTIATGNSRMSVWEWAWVEVFVPEVWTPDADLIFQGQSRDERREIQLERMRLSQDNATLVALSVLGHDVFDDAGALIVSVAPGTPADGHLAPNDVVVGIDGRPIANAPELIDELVGHPPGSVVTFDVRRATAENPGGVVSQVDIELGMHPDDASRPFLGVELDTQVVDAPLPFEISIDAGEVGGPSAGTAFTLGLLDLLTEGELTGGRRVAVTGTMELNGCIGNIGGLAQKAVAARNAGADLFIVPLAQVAELDDVELGVMEVVGAAGLDDALDVLGDRGGDISGIADFDTDCGS